MKTAIEIGEEILKAEVRVMDKDEATSLAMLALTPSEKPLPEKGVPLAVKIAQTRLAYHKVGCSPRVLLMIGILCDRPGTVMLYVAAIKALSARNGNQPVTFIQFIEGFPNGFPTEKELHRIWLGQKVTDGSPGSDNWIDRAEAWREAA
jgi:hypothetical protein